MRAEPRGLLEVLLAGRIIFFRRRVPFFSIDLFDRSFSKQRSIEKFDRDNVFDCGKFGEKYKRSLAAARSDSRSGAAEVAHSFDA